MDGPTGQNWRQAFVKKELVASKPSMIAALSAWKAVYYRQHIRGSVLFAGLFKFRPPGPFGPFGPALAPFRLFILAHLAQPTSSEPVSRPAFQHQIANKPPKIAT